MFEFEVIQELKANDEILESIKDYDYTIKNGKIKHLKTTNLQFIEPTEYLITGVRIDIWTHLMRGCITRLCTLT